MADEQTQTEMVTDAQTTEMDESANTSTQTQTTDDNPLIEGEHVSIDRKKYLELVAEKERVAEALRKANKDHAVKRKRLEELEAAEQQRKEAQMSEMEKLQAEVERQRKAAEEAKAERERIQAESEATALKTAVLLKASAMDFEHPEDAFALINTKSIKKGENGEYTGIEEALKTLEGRLPKRGNQQRQAPRVGATNPGASAHTGKTDDQLRAEIFGTPSRGGAMTRGVAEQHGGGVVWTKTPEQ